MLHHGILYTDRHFSHTEEMGREERSKNCFRVMKNVQIKFNFAGAYNLKSKHLTSHHEVLWSGEGDFLSFFVLRSL